ncbi:CBS domain-containing protein [Streptomyces anthocyanicus]|uniref:CBS domain-containing protein n=1 Tax=Streptomyces anthocyanicus TaxID=68174 RepID=UPI0037FC87B3
MLNSPRTVNDVMTHTAVAVGPEAPFKDIIALLDQWKVSALPVLEGEGRVIGLVSEADLLPKEEFRDSDPDRFTQMRRLTDLAKAGGLTAADVMTAPVVNAEGLLEGVVSRADLLKVFLRTDDAIAEEVGQEVVTPLFPSPAETVRVEVSDGLVTLGGRVRDTSLVPVAARLARAVEGVVDVRWDPTDVRTSGEGDQA